MASVSASFPRVTIQFCTQCKWMLRAAYFAQELLSTFGTALGEVALQPSTGGTFNVSLYSSVPLNESDIQVRHHVLWDRKAEGGFPETKELKRRVRDIIEPGRDLGHVDGKKKSVPGINVDTSEHGRQESNENQDAFKDKTQRQEAKEEQDMRRLCAISNIQAQGQESERKFTLMDVDGVEMKIEGVEAEFKRNPDGSICEDCN